MISLNIKWFVGLSVAAHAAVLVAWQSPVLIPGNSGRTLQLSVNQQSGAVPAQTTRTAPVEAQSQPKAAPRPIHATGARNSKTATTQKPVAREKPALPESIHLANNQPDIARATASSNPVMQQQDIDQHLRNSVMELITQALTYPAIARRKGWQGIVTIELHIEADGFISSLQIDETSGYAVLDSAAMQCLRTASVPNATQWLQGKAIDLIVPVEYRLTGTRGG